MIRTKEDLRCYTEADKRMLERGAYWSSGLRLKDRAAAAPVGVLAQPVQNASHRVLGQVSLATADVHGSSAWILAPSQCLRQRAQHRARWLYRRQPLCAHRREQENQRGLACPMRLRLSATKPTLGSGAELVGRFEVAGRIAVGANAVVNKSFGEPDIFIGGAPAKKISDKGNPYYKGGMPE